jgi:putative drug exporter of the RND superfamily
VSRLFAAWGRVVHRHPWLVLAISAALLALSVAGLVRGGTVSSASQYPSDLEARRAADLAAGTQTGQAPAAGSSFILLFRSPDHVVADAAYRTALESAVRPLGTDHRVLGVETPYNEPAAAGAALVSRDGHEAAVTVVLRDPYDTAKGYWRQVVGEVQPGPLTMRTTGDVAIRQAFGTTLEDDLRRAELVTLPVTLILLLVIFASALAALLPLGVGVLTIVGGLGGTLLLARYVTVSQYALNVVTLVGLGVSIDYSLFVVNRFREELAAGASREDALAATLATAGRAIFFSGLTVAIGLSALLFYQGTFMASMGLAGAIVVGVAILYGLTFLPAVLALLGPRVNRLRLPLPRAREGDEGLWGRLAAVVMRRPLLVLLPALSLLLVAGSPFLSIRLANGNVDMLPPGQEARTAYDTLQSDFPAYDQNEFTVVVHYSSGDSASGDRPAHLAALAGRIGTIPGVLRVTDPEMGPHVAVLRAISNRPVSSDGARDVLREIRAERVPGAEVLVTGATAFDADDIAFILQRTPLAVAFVVGVTLVVLFLLTGSVVLPVKAVLTNLVSISASFGALVWIFQQGHLSGLLGFTPQALDPSVPVLLFATVFGLSMDYEVMLVSRIQEEYGRTGDNVRAVTVGLSRSGRLITGAAAIMFVVFLAFGLAQVVLIKALGIGLAIAIAVDATIVRALVVPSLMRLLGSANWWAPAPLRWLYRRAGAAEAAPETRAA